MNAPSSPRIARSLAAALLVAASFAPCGSRPLLAQATPAPRHAPEFVRPGLNGKPVDLRAYRGKLVLLNFWATWCAPCEVEMPHFVDWQKKYGPQGLQIVGISMDDDPALARAAYRKLKLNYPVAMGDQKLGRLYGGILGLPITYLIDTHGNIRAKFQGETDLNQIESQMQSLLPRKP